MEMIFNRLKKNYKSLYKWLNQKQIQAFRLYDRDIPEYPFIVDVYNDHAVIYERGRKDFDLIGSKKDHPLHIRAALQKLLEIPEQKIVYKSRLRQKGSTQYIKEQSSESKYLIVSEGACQYEVNLSDYLDTGLFMDHRPMREKLYQESNNLNVLNLFCYTGSVSVAAALGGARTISVDLSRNYLNWAKRNFHLNQLNINHHKFILQDVKTFLIETQNESQKYDIIFLDPPTFSNSKKTQECFDVQKQHFDFIQLCMKLLTQDGVLYFSTNKRDFQLSSEVENLYQINNMSLSTIPRDFRDQKIHQCYKITPFKKNLCKKY